MSEIIFLAILALIVIGPKELPQLARTLGRFINELKRSTNVLGDELKSQTGLDRINLNENTSVVKPAVEQEKTEHAPIQMELSEQSVETSKVEQKEIKEERKNS
ncbi:MAG: Sec-independent protein translocase subunit TatA/TatB [Bdellovibrio sp.]